jgi:hypothetical protein
VFSVTGLLGTYFLRETFLSWKRNTLAISAKLAEADINTAPEEAKIVAKAIRTQMREQLGISSSTAHSIKLIAWDKKIQMKYALCFQML